MTVEEQEEETLPDLKVEEPEMPIKIARRPKNGMLKDFDEEETIRGSFTIPVHYYEAIQKEAEEQSVSVGHMLRQYVKEHFDKIEAEIQEESEEEGEEEEESEEDDW
mgnify:CR=1 FL=1|jgi:hypothetical protein